MKRALLAICGMQLVVSLFASPTPVGADSYSPRAVFNLVDANRDGSISYNEWKQFITAAASAFPPKAATCFERSRLGIFAVLDRTHDGRISWPEWRSAGARGYDPDFPDCL